MPEIKDVRVKEVIQRSYNVKSVRFEVGCETNFLAGQFLQVTLNSDDLLKRYLSISNSPTEKGYIEFTKKITESDFSKALVVLKVGDLVKVQYPLGKFTIEDNAPGQKIAFLSGGIGITPLRSIAKYVVDKKLDIDMVLLYANRSLRDIVFRDDFEAMQKVHPSFKVAHMLCEPAPNFKCSIGLINAAAIKNEIPDFIERKFFLCGPPGMVEAMKKMLSVELALPKENIISENFTGY